MLEELKQNFHLRNLKPFFLVSFFRISQFVAKSNLIIKVIGLPIRVLYRLITEWVMGVEIPDTTVIGYGMQLHHGTALVINPNVKIGRNVKLRNSTTIGCKTDYQGECIAWPVIGDNVNIGPNVVIFGDIVIGNNVVIGAGSVVLKDVEDNCIIAGNPARVIKSLV